jgi:hypothetical protein
MAFVQTAHDKLARVYRHGDLFEKRQYRAHASNRSAALQPALRDAHASPAAIRSVGGASPPVATWRRPSGYAPQAASPQTRHVVAKGAARGALWKSAPQQGGVVEVERSGLGVRREKAALSSGCKPHLAIRSSRKQPEQAWRRRNV